MRTRRQVVVALCVWSIGATAGAQESRTVGARQVMVGDVAHRVETMEMDIDATFTIEGLSTAPAPVHVHVSKASELRFVALRAPTDPKGALYRVEVVRLEQTEANKPTQVSTWVGRTALVEVAKQKVKAVGGAKATAAEVDELLKVISDLKDPFVAGLSGARSEGRTLTVGDSVSPAEVGVALPSELPPEFSLTVTGFAPNPDGERALLALSMNGPVHVNDMTMDVSVAGSIQVDEQSGWVLGTHLEGSISVAELTTQSDAGVVHISMNGPMTVESFAEFTGADGRSFGGLKP